MEPNNRPSSALTQLTVSRNSASLSKYSARAPCVSLALMMITLLKAPPYHHDTCFLAGLRLNELGAGPGPDTDNGPSNRAFSSSESAMSPTPLLGPDASRRSCRTTRGTAATISAADGVGSRGAAGRPSVAPLPALPCLLCLGRQLCLGLWLGQQGRMSSLTAPTPTLSGRP